MDIGATVRATVKRVLTTFAGTESVTIVGPSQTMHGWWDPTAVEQIVTNLLSNALKFGQGRSVRLIVRGAGAGVTISVRDQGAGIARRGPAAHLQAQRARARRRRAAAWARAVAGARAGAWRTAAASRCRAARAAARRSPFCCARSRRCSAAESEAVVRRLPPQRSPMRAVSTQAEPAADVPPPTGRTGWPGRRRRCRCRRAARSTSRRPRR